MSILSQPYNIIIYRGISAVVNGGKVVDGLNNTDKRFILNLMATFQLPVSKRFDTQLEVHIATQNTDVSLAPEFQKHLSHESHKHVIIDQGKHKKRPRKKCTNREYYVQHNKDIDHQDVTMFSATNKFPEIKFVGPHNKPHGVRAVGKHFHIRFDPKLGYVTYAIHHTSIACTLCTLLLTKPGLKVFQHSNNIEINLSNIAHTGLCWVTLTTGTL